MWRHLLNRRCVPRVVSLSQPLYSGCLSPVACVVHCNDDLGSNYHATSNKYHSLCHSGVNGRTSFCDDSSKTRLLLSQQDHTLSYSQRRGKKTKKERKKQDQKQKQKDLKDGTFILIESLCLLLTNTCPLDHIRCTSWPPWGIKELLIPYR